MSSYIEGFEDGVRTTKAEYLKLLEEETHPSMTLTTKEIADVWFSLYKEAIPMMDVVILTTFGEAILRKAQEK
jgi:hypothetical protein